MLAGEVNHWMTYRYKTKTITLTQTHLVLRVKGCRPDVKPDEYCLREISILPPKKHGKQMALRCHKPRTSVTSRFLQNSSETLYLAFKTAEEMQSWESKIEQQKKVV